MQSVSGSEPAVLLSRLHCHIVAWLRAKSNSAYLFILQHIVSLSLSYNLIQSVLTRFWEQHAAFKLKCLFCTSCFFTWANSLAFLENNYLISLNILLLFAFALKTHSNLDSFHLSISRTWLMHRM